MIRDSSGAVLAGAAVSAVPESGGQTVSGITDASGRYSLAIVAERTYRVIFSSPGFAERSEVVVTGAAGGVVTRDATLAPSSFAEDVSVAADLRDVHAVGTRLGLSRQQTPASVDIVTQELIQARGADTASTALRGVTGVTSSLRPGASAVFSTRGFIENSVGVLFNGVRVQSSTVTMRNYDAFNFERVEVLRGPASVLHGEGTAAGAINFVRRTPQPGRTSADFLLETGDAGRFRAGGAAAGGLGSKASYAVSFARNQFHTHVDATAHEYNHVTGALQASLGRLVVGVEGDWLMSEVDDPYWGTPLVNGSVDASLIGRNYNRSENNRYDDNVGWGRGTVAAPLGMHASYSGQVYVYRADRDWRNSYGFEFQPATGQVLRRAVENLGYDHKLLGTRHEVSVDFSMGGRSGKVVAGIEAAATDFSSPRSYGARISVDAWSPGAPAFDAPARLDDRRADLRQTSAFGEFRLDIAKPVTLVLGGRVGRLKNDISRPASNVAFSQSFRPADGRVGVVITPRSAVSFYGQYATGSEPVEALLILGPAESGFTLAHSSSWEAGAKASAWQGRADITAAVYHLSKRDLTTTDPEVSTRTIQIGAQSSRGVELALVARPTPRWLVEGNVAALDARYDLFYQGSVSRSGNLPPNVPELVLNVGATWRPTDLVEAGAWLTRVGDRTADTTATVFQPAYTLIDPFVRIAFGRRGDLTLRMRNAGNARYVEWATQAFGVTNVYFGEPRRVILSLRVRL